MYTTGYTSPVHHPGLYTTCAPSWAIHHLAIHYLGIELGIPHLGIELGIPHLGIWPGIHHLGIWPGIHYLGIHSYIHPWVHPVYTTLTPRPVTAALVLAVRGDEALGSRRENKPGWERLCAERVLRVLQLLGGSAQSYSVS